MPNLQQGTGRTGEHLAHLVCHQLHWFARLQLHHGVFLLDATWMVG